MGFEVEYGNIKSSLWNFFRTKKQKREHAVTVASSSNSTITRADHAPGSWEAKHVSISVFRLLKREGPRAARGVFLL